MLLRVCGIYSVPFLCSITGFSKILWHWWRRRHCLDSFHKKKILTFLTILNRAISRLLHDSFKNSTRPNVSSIIRDSDIFRSISILPCFTPMLYGVCFNSSKILWNLFFSPQKCEIFLKITRISARLFGFLGFLKMFWMFWNVLDISQCHRSNVLA